ncbi:hypothetical protein F183_A42750 [Bryobacterales bacterium F-183]|nr:hypothetical protein F183_A42750 [Bryobacterales bacterium F-183]
MQAVTAAGQRQRTKEPEGLGQVFWSLGKTAFKVSAGYAVVIAVLTAIHYPYQVDEEGRSPDRKYHGSFYGDIYAAPKTGGKGVRKQFAEPEPPAEDSKYVRLAKQAIENERIVPKVTSFAQTYGLTDKSKRVLDVGAGTGYLQDVVPNYVGLDISPSAKRYFHKTFVEASATEMPFPDDSFDGAWSIWVLEHVPKPEQALAEIRRVVKDGGVVFLKPAWDCPWWLAQGYEVRPYSELDWKGKLRKASLNVVGSPYYRGASLIPTRFLRQAQAKWSGGPTRLHYKLLQPNYMQYWVADSDALNNLDYYEMLLWFTSRGDECLNCEADPIWDANELIIRVHKKQS